MFKYLQILFFLRCIFSSFVLVAITNIIHVLTIILRVVSLIIFIYITFYCYCFENLIY